MTWPDIVISVIAILGAYKGYKSGFVSELTGIIALVCAIIAGFFYGGFWDDTIGAVLHLGPGSSHVLGVIAFAGEIYALVIIAGILLGRFAKLPIISTGNAILGAVIGFVKAMAFLWVLLYVALFFPLPADLRRDFHQSVFVNALTQPNQQLDDKFRDSLPWFAKLFATPFFSRHRV